MPIPTKVQIIARFTLEGLADGRTVYELIRDQSRAVYVRRPIDGFDGWIAKLPDTHATVSKRALGGAADAFEVIQTPGVDGRDSSVLLGLDHKNGPGLRSFAGDVSVRAGAILRALEILRDSLNWVVPEDIAVSMRTKLQKRSITTMPIGLPGEIPSLLQVLVEPGGYRLRSLSGETVLPAFAAVTVEAGLNGYVLKQNSSAVVHARDGSTRLSDDFMGIPTQIFHNATSPPQLTDLITMVRAWGWDVSPLTTRLVEATEGLFGPATGHIVESTAILPTPLTPDPPNLT